MQVKISKTLEGIIARAAFNTTKAGIDHSLKDFLMLEMLREEGSLAYQLLSSRLKDWELYQVRLRIEREVLGAGRRENTGAEEFYRAFTDELCAVSGAVRSVSTAHALRAIVGDRSTATSRVLEMYGITGEVVSEDIKKFAAGDDFRTEIQVHMLDFSEENKPEEKNTSHVLDKFGVNLTQMAREGKIDPVVGREQEIERVVQILSRRKKNNPILIGEAGVGKSAIIEGLALRIARGEVPYTIADKTLFSLDVSSLVAGTKFRGEFEERMQQLLDELRKAKDTIIFIDEIHTIVGAGSTQGSLDTANILKPALARGELQTIGATTLDEYRENIESDSALERRFQKVVVEPTTPEQTLQILRNTTSSTTRYAIRKRRCKPAWNSPGATSPTASSRTRRSMCWTRRARAYTCNRRANRPNSARWKTHSTKCGANAARRSKNWSTKRPPRHACAKSHSVRNWAKAATNGSGRSKPTPWRSRPSISSRSSPR